MDNASFHKRLEIQDSIRKAGHLLLLPPYSPQLNPIEHQWAQAKAIRKQLHGSISELFSLQKRESVYPSFAIPVKR